MFLLEIHISNELSDNNVFHTVQIFYKCNELRYDFKLLPIDVKPQSFFLLSRCVEPYYVSRSKMVRLLWNLCTTHCDFLTAINSFLPMDIAFKKDM